MPLIGAILVVALAPLAAFNQFLNWRLKRVRAAAAAAYDAQANVIQFEIDEEPTAVLLVPPVSIRKVR